MILHSEGCGSDPMPWQLINHSEEFAPHTNDPQGLAEVLFLKLNWQNDMGLR